MNVNAGHERTSKARIIHQIQLIRGITNFHIFHLANRNQRRICRIRLQAHSPCRPQQ
ncbi:hypothetical protein [Shigella dysenteriae]|nr:hypothetical protein [Shigella dysenteriae]WNT52370.1 hypothetical protein PWP84_09905 [Shigella dysenteriae]